MIDLNELDKRIDELFETETSDSLTEWLLNERLGNVKILLGAGSFFDMVTTEQTLTFNKNHAVYNSENDCIKNIPKNKYAA